MPLPVLSRWHASVGRRLRFARRAANLSMSELGTRIGTSYQMYQRYEAGTGRLPADVADKLSRQLDVDVRWLLGQRASKDCGIGFKQAGAR